MIESMFPIVSTPDLERAIAFYRDLLGGVVSFQFPPDGEPGYVGVDLGSSHLGIGRDPSTAQGGQAQRVSLWVYVQDCDAAVERLRAGGAPIIEEPADQPWGERVARAADPDGNVIVLGSR